MSYAERLGAIEARLDKLEQAQRPEPTPDSGGWRYEIRIMHGDKKEYGWCGGIRATSVFRFCQAAQYLADAAGRGDVTDLLHHLQGLPVPDFNFEGYPKP